MMNREAYERARGGLPGRVVAARADLAEAYLSRIINGHIVPSVAIARRIADAVSVPLDVLWPSSATKPTGTDPHKVTSIADAGRKGGKARAAKLTPEQLSAQGQRAARARWGREASRYASANDGHAYPVAA